jgi:hypothetical protein
MPTKIVSFKNAAPAAEAPASNVNAPAVEDDEALSPATQSTSLAPASDYGVDAQDITLPRLRLLQGTSDKAQLAKFGFGSLLLKDSVVVARPLVPTTPGAPASPTARVGRVVFCRLASKGYAEKAVKYGDPTQYATSLAEVEQLGGTANWAESRENRKIVSTEPWFQVVANCIVLIEQPEGENDDHFPFAAGGKNYAPAMYSVKSFAYDEFFKKIATAKATGELRREGFPSRFINFGVEIRPGKGNAEFAVPSVTFGEPTADEVRVLAAQF